MNPPRANGVDLVLYCTFPIPEQTVLPVLELLTAWGFHTDMLVDTGLVCGITGLDSNTPHFSVIPPEWMGSPMSSIQEVQDWIARIASTLKTGTP